MKAMEKVVGAIVSQFRRPSGFGGRLAGLEMAVRASNRKRNAWAVDLLGVRPTDHVLEIGFGPGVAIRELAKCATEGLVVGIDHSEVMVEAAKRRNIEGVRANRIDLRLGSAEALPSFDQPFDKILSVNSVMFWTEPVRRLEELRGLLRAGGVIAVVRQPRGPGSRMLSPEQVGAELTQLLDAAGFAQIRTERLDLKPPVVCALGVNAA